MIEVLRDESVSRFLQLAGPLLYKHEAVNSLMLGLCEGMISYPPEKLPILFRVVDDGETVSAAIQTPPMNLVLAHGSEDVLKALAAALMASSASFPGVVGPSEASELFAHIWAERTGQPYSLGMGQKIYELTSIALPEKIPGEFRAASEQDADLIETWAVEFARESLPASDIRGPEFWRFYAFRATQSGSAYFWSIGGKPVAVAHVGRPTRNGISINGVYTPPSNRKNGYASALVAHLSQRMLDSGKKFCVLYTDLANPTSNKIYQAVGYREIAASKHFIFSGTHD